MDTLPRSLTPALHAFCAGISASRPVFVRSKPSADAQPSACFDNVARKIERAGGSTIYGWAIWHVPGFYFEAEHHGIWRNRAGALLDVSPQMNAYPKILFLPDEAATFDSSSIRSNIMKPDSDNPVASEFVGLSNEKRAIEASYRTGEYTVAFLRPSDAAELGRIERRIQQLWHEFRASRRR